MKDHNHQTTGSGGAIFSDFTEIKVEHLWNNQPLLHSLIQLLSAPSLLPDPRLATHPHQRAVNKDSTKTHTSRLYCTVPPHTTVIHNHLITNTMHIQLLKITVEMFDAQHDSAPHYLRGLLLISHCCWALWLLSSITACKNRMAPCLQWCSKLAATYDKINGDKISKLIFPWSNYFYAPHFKVRCLQGT